MYRPLTAFLIATTITSFAWGNEVETEIETESSSMDIQHILEWTRTKAFAGIDDNKIKLTEEKAQRALRGITLNCKRENYDSAVCELYTQQWQAHEEDLAEMADTKSGKAGAFMLMYDYVERNHLARILPFVEERDLDKGKERAREIRQEVEDLDQGGQLRAKIAQRIWDSWNKSTANVQDKIKRNVPRNRKKARSLSLPSVAHEVIHTSPYGEAPEQSYLLVEEFDADSVGQELPKARHNVVDLGK